MLRIYSIYVQKTAEKFLKKGFYVDEFCSTGKCELETWSIKDISDFDSPLNRCCGNDNNRIEWLMQAMLDKPSCPIQQQCENNTNVNVITTLLTKTYRRL